MSLRLRSFAFLFGVLVVGSLFRIGPCFADDERPRFSVSTAEIVKADGSRIKLAVEVASSPEQQAYGLMFVKRMEDDRGMLFPFLPPQRVSFWMKNTLIPLDMLFIRSSGVIARISANAKPGDLTPAPSGDKVGAVLEVNGGFAEKHGVRVGDRIESPVLLRP